MVYRRVREQNFRRNINEKMKTKTILTSCVLAATLLQSHAATATNSAPTEGVAVETGVLQIKNEVKRV